MRDAIDHHAPARIVNGVEDPIATDPQPIRAGRSFQLLCPGHSWIVGERFDSMPNAWKHIRREAAELTASGRDVENVIHQAGSLERSVNLRHGDELLAAVSLEVGDVFQILKQIDEPAKLTEWQLDRAAAASGIRHILSV